MKYILDISGHKFNKLTAIKPLLRVNSNYRRLWEFKCDCGKICILPASRVKRGDTKSCGCLRSAQITHYNYNVRKRIDVFDANSNGIYNYYKIGAYNRNYEFTISKEFFRSLIVQNCYYCGMPPSNRTTVYKNPRPDQYSMYTGIDRFNNALGYHEDNCVPCCCKCNTAKMSMNFYEFLDHISKIIIHITQK